MSAHRIRTSEPAYRAPLSQAQRDRMGRVLPKRETLPISRREERATYAVVLLMVLSIVVFGVVL